MNSNCRTQKERKKSILIEFSTANPNMLVVVGLLLFFFFFINNKYACNCRLATGFINNFSIYCICSSLNNKINTPNRYYSVAWCQVWMSHHLQ